MKEVLIEMDTLLYGILPVLIAMVVLMCIGGFWKLDDSVPKEKDGKLEKDS